MSQHPATLRVDSTLFRSGAFATLLVLVGTGLRLERLLADRSLWVDEARLALNVLARTPAQLLSPLDYDQGAPPGFLLLLKLACVTLGGSELVLRTVPFLAGVAALGVFAVLVRRVLPGAAGLAALALFACAEPLVYYSADVKPYSCDVLVACGVLWAAVAWVQEGPRAARVALLALVGALGLWLSYTAVFVCAGVSATLVLLALRAPGRRGLVPAIAVAALFALSFGSEYLLVLRAAASNPQLHRFWAAGFAPLLPHTLSDWRWYPESFFGAFRDPAGLAFPGLAALCAGLGAVLLWRRAPALLAVLLAPLPVLFVASVLRLYPISTRSPIGHPYHGRLVLFLVPCLYLLVAAGLEGLRGAARRGALAGAAAALLLAHPVAGALERAASPPRFQELRPVVAFVADRLRPDDAIYAYHEALPGLRYYARRFDRPHLADAREIPESRSLADYAALVASMPDDRRVWVVYAHHPLWRSRDEERFVLDDMERQGRVLAGFEAEGASVHLIWLRPGAGHASP